MQDGNKFKVSAGAKWRLTALYAVYLILLAWTINRHQLWGDELHSWNIAKASGGFLDLIHNTRFEGHPPLWYTLLWALSKFSLSPTYVQCLQFLIAGASVGLLLFLSPFPTVIRSLLPFGYYLFFEYGVFSRNYAIALLLCFAILIVLCSPRRNVVIYYLLLLLLLNTHLLAAILAAAIHLFYLIKKKEDGSSPEAALTHVFVGVLLFLPTLYQVFPSSDSEMNMSFWMKIWSKNQLHIIGIAPLKSFAPVPAWWEYHFWNTQFLTQVQCSWTFLSPLTYILSLLFIGCAIYILSGSRKSVLMFCANLFLTMLFGLIFPLTSMRYVGFIYIGFIVALWLRYCDTKQSLSPLRFQCLTGLLTLQILGAVVAVYKHNSGIFSNSYKVAELIRNVPKGEKVVTDYYCLNNVLSYVKSPFYCIETNKQASFILWDQSLSATTNKWPYARGAKRLFEEDGFTVFYMVSTYPPQALQQMDSLFFAENKVELADKREGAIERYSNIYLYRISK